MFGAESHGAMLHLKLGVLYIPSISAGSLSKASLPQVFGAQERRLLHFTKDFGNQLSTRAFSALDH